MSVFPSVSPHRPQRLPSPSSPRVPAAGCVSTAAPTSTRPFLARFLPIPNPELKPQPQSRP
eukprot:355798-Chlamydomonas_euryale.AAC.7